MGDVIAELQNDDLPSAVLVGCSIEVLESDGPSQHRSNYGTSFIPYIFIDSDTRSMEITGRLIPLHFDCAFLQPFIYSVS